MPDIPNNHRNIRRFFKFAKRFLGLVLLVLEIVNGKNPLLFLPFFKIRS